MAYVLLFISLAVEGSCTNFDELDPGIMKVSASAKSNKMQPNHGLTAISSLAQGLGNGSAEADALLKEFSEVMDKIAAKLKDSPSAKKVNDFSDFGLGLPELVKPEQISKEKVVTANPQRDEDSPIQADSKSPDKQSTKETTERGQPDSSDNSKPLKEAKDLKEGKELAQPTPRTERKEAGVDRAAKQDVQSPATALKSTDVAMAKPVDQADLVAVEAPQAQPAAVKAATTDAKVISKQNDGKAEQAISEVQPEAKSSTQEQGTKDKLPTDDLKLPDIVSTKSAEPSDTQQTTEAMEASIRNALSKAVDAMIGRTQLESFKRAVDREFQGASHANKQVSEIGAAQGLEDHKAVNPAGNTSNGVGSFARNADSTARAEAPRAPRAMTQAASLRTMEKVESALKEAAKSRDGKTISLRLDPPDLGSVKIDVSLRDGNLHARIVAETPAVNQFLREKSHELQSMLRKLGLEVDSVSVSVGNEQQSNEQQPFAWAQKGKGAAVPNFVQGEAPSGSSEGERAVYDHWVA